ncbi:hypothetical protein [Labedaea rhizosphaerae]|uniref:Uncharacterized protein n=1 Tax=Labedaea rhizosphaerae TaxID=598644 RepID=A0A4V3CZD4_LABRH|nr:hypothetical protein [Labedaea rhizosphaerae]TDP97588.1 hypothetical protein EV186_103552 [Labedaea rhizosphaerae]
MPRARFFFDAGSGSVLWSDDDPARERFDYAIELDALPLSDGLRAELNRLIHAYDDSVDWDYPPNPTPWSPQQCARFNGEVRAAMTRLRAELGPEWEVVDGFRELPEG